MTEARTYQGSCHCGAVRFEVTTKLEKAMACNCSICARAGYLLAFVPAAQFKLLSGADAQTDYQFGKKSIHHLFCRTCGIRSFGRGEVGGAEMFAVNLRCLEGVDPESLPVQRFDGKSL